MIRDDNEHRALRLSSALRVRERPTDEVRHEEEYIFRLGSCEVDGNFGVDDLYAPSSVSCGHDGEGREGVVKREMEKGGKGGSLRQRTAAETAHTRTR